MGMNDAYCSHKAEELLAAETACLLMVGQIGRNGAFTVIASVTP